MENFTQYYTDLYTKMFQGGKTNNVIFDPLSSIIRLLTLYYREQGTKLCFSANSISFDDPVPILQWVFRKFKGAKKDDLTILKIPISQFINCYNMNNVQLNAFAQGAVKGLKKLQICYQGRKDEPILDCIEYYSSMLEKSLKSSPPKESTISKESKESTESTEEESKYYTEENNTESSENSETVDMKSEENSLFSPSVSTSSIELFKKLWTPAHVNFIYSLYLELDEQFKNGNQDNVNLCLLSIDYWLLSKDKTLKDLKEFKQQQ